MNHMLKLWLQKRNKTNKKKVSCTVTSEPVYFLLLKPNAASHDGTCLQSQHMGLLSEFKTNLVCVSFRTTRAK